MHLSIVLTLLQSFIAIAHINAQPLKHLSSSQSHQQHVHLHHHCKDPENVPISNAQHILESNFENIVETRIETVISPDKPLTKATVDW